MINSGFFKNKSNSDELRSLEFSRIPSALLPEYFAGSLKNIMKYSGGETVEVVRTPDYVVATPEHRCSWILRRNDEGVSQDELHNC